MKTAFKNYLFILVPIAIVSLVACKQVADSKMKITIAAAANMQFAIEEISRTFTKQTEIECQLVISSSGKLTAQIAEGAPYDIFLSADMKYPNKLYREGHAQSPPKTYAYGRLVLWTMNKNINPTIEVLNAATIKHIAIASPKTAPYGSAAIEILNHHEILNAVEHKLVYGESISQVNQFISSQSAEIGFTAMSVVASSEMLDKGQWAILNSDHHTPIQQGAVLIDHNSADVSSAQQFYSFLFSNEAKQILKKFGYSIDE